MAFIDDQVQKDLRVREFTLGLDGRPVTGVLWSDPDANPGLHPAVPVEELRHSVEFLVAGLTGSRRERDAPSTIAG